MIAGRLPIFGALLMPVGPSILPVLDPPKPSILALDPSHFRSQDGCLRPNGGWISDRGRWPWSRILPVSTQWMRATSKGNAPNFHHSSGHRPAPRSPAGAAHRGAHLRGLPRLLSARHAARPAQAAGCRPHPAGGARQDAAIQMLDVHFPTTDGRTLILSRYTEPNSDQKLLLRQLDLTLPSQPPPRITAPAPAAQHPQPAM